MTWILFGVSIASWIPSFNKLIYMLTKRETRATTYGRIDSFRNLAAFPTPYLGGVLYVSLGLYAPLYIGMSLLFILLLIEYRMFPD
jgi:hypothetical protein